MHLLGKLVDDESSGEAYASTVRRVARAISSRRRAQLRRAANKVRGRARVPPVSFVDQSPFPLVLINLIYGLHFTIVLCFP